MVLFAGDACSTLQDTTIEQTIDREDIDQLPLLSGLSHIYDD